MKQFKQFEEAYGRSDAYTRDYRSSVSGMGKRQSAAYRTDGGGNDERHDLDTHSKPADHPHSVHINGKKWKTFGSQSHASNVAKKIKGATVHKEEVELHELSSDLLQRYKDKARKSSDELTSQGKHKKSLDRITFHMKATGKQIDKTTAGIKKALNKEEVNVFSVLEEAANAIDKGEYDYEGQMARTQLQTTLRNCQDLIKMIEDDENMPEWVQSKITLAQDYITTVRDYLQSKEELGEAVAIKQDAKLAAIAKVRKEKMKSFRQHVGKK